MERTHEEAGWSGSRKFLFRLVFCLLVFTSLLEGHGTAFSPIPLFGSTVAGWFRRPFDSITIWVGVHVFHLTGRAATIHGVTGDRALAWVALLLTLIASVIAAAVWSLLDRGRSDYRELLLWFRLGLSLALGLALLPFAWIKVFPIQFPSPPIALLNEPVGNASPTLLFWSLYGLHPVFEMALGWTEVLTAILLLFRRTAFLGAVFAFVVMANVALLDLTFDVPVKLWSLTMLVMATALLIPEAKWLSSFFLNRSALPRRPQWAPEPKTTKGKRIALSAEILLVLLVCGNCAWGTWTVFRMKLDSLKNPPSFAGEWKVAGYSGIKGPDGQIVTTLFFDPNSDMMLRDEQGTMWRSRAVYNHQTHVLRVLWEAGGFMMFSVDQRSTNDLILTPTGPTASRMRPMTLTRVPLPASYPLLQRQFHWVNDFEPLR